MLARAACDAMAALPIRDVAAALGGARVLIVAPHPDDESLGCGGLIAELCARRLPPTVAILTDGTMSHPSSPSYPAARLRSVREQEATDATALLGLPPQNLVFLRHRDTRAPGEGQALIDAAETLAQLMESRGCTVILTTWRHDPHCDHEAAAAIAALAASRTGARLLAYPVWGWTLPPGQPLDQPEIHGFRIDVSAHLERKRAAILAHRSQYAGLIDDDPGGFQLEPGFIDRFLTGTEVFVEASP